LLINWKGEEREGGGELVLTSINWQKKKIHIAQEEGEQNPRKREEDSPIFYAEEKGER